MKSHWFFINSNTLEIYTYGLGDHPTKTYKFDSKEDYDEQVRRFMESDDYDFEGDQA